MTQTLGRGVVTVPTHPSQATGFRGEVEFSDDTFNGADIYEVGTFDKHSLLNILTSVSGAGHSYSLLRRCCRGDRRGGEHAVVLRQHNRDEYLPPGAMHNGSAAVASLALTHLA